VKTDVYTVALKGVRTDTQKLPELLITEMAVDTSNTGAKDGYEFIEVYNNTNKAVHLNNYKMKYRHPEKGKESDTVWPFERDDVDDSFRSNTRVLGEKPLKRTFDGR
jgi:type VI protein secretion system component Hcp